MTYYLMLSGDTKENIDFDSNCLGEQSFGVFWAAEGLKALMNISKKDPDKLKDVKIITSKSKEITVEQFLDIIKNLQIRTN